MNGWMDGISRNMDRFICLVVLNVFLVRCISAAGPNFDNCDWYGSGTLEMALSRGVQPVYLRCNHGIVQWSYPQGALRIVLQHRNTETDFAACIRRSKFSSGARIYLAGKKKLHLVFRAEDPIDLVKCVASHNREVALYVEADPIADALRQATAEFKYHLKKLVKRSGEFDDDCQPCSEDELLRHYCSSDFVFQGAVTSLFHNPVLQLTELTVRVSQIHRGNQLDKFTKLSNSTKDSLQYVILHRPLKCGTKAGSGEYIFLGKWILGDPNLYCIPRLSEWKKVRRKALTLGKNECLLNL